MEGKKKLKKFLSSAGSIVIGAILAAVAIPMCLFGIMEAGGLIGVLVVGIMAAVGIFLFWTGIQDRRKLSCWLDEMEETGRLSMILREFEGGEQFFKGKLRMGDTYVFGKGAGQVYTYGEIARVYQYIHKRNFVEDNRELRFKDPQGKERTLCAIPLRGKGDEELKRAIIHIARRNPNVKIGYQ